MIRKAFSFSSRAKGISLSLIAWLAFVAVFFALYKPLGSFAAMFAVVPVIVSSWSLGFRAGIIISLLTMPFELVLLYFIRSPDLETMLGFPFLTVTAIYVVIGVVIGKLRDVSQRFEFELAERRRAEAQLRQINECLLGLGADPLDNINRLTALAGELVGADCVLYNRLDAGMLCSWGQWHTPPRYNPQDKPEGHICYDVIRTANDTPLIIRNLPATSYAQSDPNVALYNLQTYIGQAVKFGDTYVGSLCAVYQRDIELSDQERRVLRAVAAAIGVEERRRQAESDVRRRTAQLEALRQVGLELTAELDLDLLLRLMAEHAYQLVDGTTGSFFLYRPEQDVLERRASIGENPRPLGDLVRRGEGLSGRVLETGQVVVVNDYQHWEGRFISSTSHQIRAAVGVPVLWGNEFLGVLNVRGRGDSPFSPADIELLQLLASQAAIATKNALLFQSEREERQLAETLQHVTATLVSTLDVDAVLGLILEQVSYLVPNDAANIMLLEGERVRVARWRGYERWGAVEFVSSFDQPLHELNGLMRARQTGQPVLVVNTHAADTWVRFGPTSWIASFIAVPIRARDELIGFLCVDSATPGFFDPVHLERLRVFADQAAVALDNARLYRAEREQFQRWQTAQAQLAQAEKMAALGRLLGAIAHEINNPLQAIQGGLDLIEEAVGHRQHPPELDRYLQITEQAVGRIAAIVRRVHDFDRPSHGVKQLLPVRPLLEQVLELADNQLKQNQIVVEQEWIGDLPPVWADADKLQQVFMNLALNAADAMRAHGGVLRVRARAGQLSDPGTGQARPAVHIEFSDTGEGIPAHLLPHLFEPFVTTEPNKTALGLSISYGIIRAHGGEISVSSREGVGTTFIILLPAA